MVKGYFILFNILFKHTDRELSLSVCFCLCLSVSLSLTDTQAHTHTNATLRFLREAVSVEDCKYSIHQRMRYLLSDCTVSQMFVVNAKSKFTKQING